MEEHYLFELALVVVLGFGARWIAWRLHLPSILLLLVAGIANFLAGKLVDSTGLTGTDRMLGVVFGTVRGALIVCVLVLLAGFTEVPKDPWWDQSVLLKHFEVMAVEVRGLLPPEIASGINY